MNIYYSPEHFELEPVAEIDYSDGDYCFDLRVVWAHRPSGRLLTARDSGCSCPSPFEDYSTIDSLDRLDVDELVRESRRDGGANCTAAEVADFLRVVRRAHRELEPRERPSRPVVPRQRYGWLEHYQPVRR
jgi:hypothetical protein